VTSFSKICEKLIYSRSYKHTCSNNILAKEQYGFRNSSSTKAASCDVINEILKAMNNRLSVGGIFCDFEKVFYCVNHEILVDKLQFYRIKGKFLALIQSYLRGRYRKLIIDKFKHMMMFLLDGEKLQMEFLRVQFWVHCFFLFI
jgi:hypothetical protein